MGVRIPFSMPMAFAMGNFHFFGRGKTNFFGEGYKFKTGYPVTILGHIPACPTCF